MTGGAEKQVLDANKELSWGKEMRRGSAVSPRSSTGAAGLGTRVMGISPGELRVPPRIKQVKHTCILECFIPVLSFLICLSSVPSASLPSSRLYLKTNPSLAPQCHHLIIICECLQKGNLNPQQGWDEELLPWSHTTLPKQQLHFWATVLLLHLKVSLRPREIYSKCRRAKKRQGGK